MTFPPPPPSPNDPPAPGPWQAPQQPYPQQPYGQQAPAPYGQQPPYGQPAAQPTTPFVPLPPTAPAGGGWVVPTVVVVSLVAIAGAFAASAVRENETGADAAADARDAVVRLTDAMYEGDCDAVQAASTGGYFRTMNLSCEEIAGNQAWMDEVGMSFVVGEADVSGDTAEVPIQFVVTSDPTQGGSGYFTVVRTGDTWRVSNDQMN